MRSILAILLILLFFSCKKSTIEVAPEMAVTKKIRFHIFSIKDYSDARYDKYNVEIRLGVRKIDNRTFEKTVLWDTVFSNRKIADFPQYDNKMEIEKSFPVFETKYKLGASYFISYDLDGQKVQEFGSDEVGQGMMEILKELGL